MSFQSIVRAPGALLASDALTIRVVSLRMKSKQLHGLRGLKILLGAEVDDDDTAIAALPGDISPDEVRAAITGGPIKGGVGQLVVEPDAMTGGQSINARLTGEVADLAKEFQKLQGGSTWEPVLNLGAFREDISLELLSSVLEGVSLTFDELIIMPLFPGEETARYDLNPIEDDDTDADD